MKNTISIKMSSANEKKFFNALFRALFKNSWGLSHPNLKFHNIYLRELLDVLHKELDEITVLKANGLPIEKDLHNFLGTNKFSFWSGVRTTLCNLLIGLDEKQGTVGLHSKREDVLHILNVFKTEVKTGQAKRNEATVQYVAKVVERILDNKERLDAVRLQKILNITKKGGQSALPVKPTGDRYSLTAMWAEDLIDCPPDQKITVAKMIEKMQELQADNEEEETHVNTYRDWWNRYKWFALNTYLFKKTLVGDNSQRKADVYEKEGIASLLPVATGSLNETQINNIKKEWGIEVTPDLALFYGAAGWWKEYPELDTEFINELSWVGFARVTY